MKSCIGIMQGRLLPPQDGKLQSFPANEWEKEFPKAVEAGLDCIEWIFDLGSEDQNPIWYDGGRQVLRALLERSGVSIRSVCADYFMRKPLLGVADAELARRIGTLNRLIENAHELGVSRIVIPFVDESSITTDRAREQAVASLRQSAAHAATLEIELDIEADLDPSTFAAFLDLVAMANVKVNYDSGNSASLGYKPAEELAAYGDRLGSVHIKDRMLGASTVPLGKGSTDFATLFRELRRLDYRGDFILQVARGADGDEIVWARDNKLRVERWLAE